MVETEARKSAAEAASRAEASSRSDDPVWSPIIGAEGPARPEPLASHLKRIASAALLAIAPVVGVLLLSGKWNFALSAAGGGLVSFAVFATLRIMVYRILGILAVKPGEKLDPPGPGAMAQFALGTFVKFGIAVGIVAVMVRLHANLLALLAGFVVAQIAIAVTVSRSLKGPV